MDSSTEKGILIIILTVLPVLSLYTRYSYSDELSKPLDEELV